MRLREFELERDYPAVLALWQSAGPGFHVSPSDSPTELARKLQRDPDLFLVAESDDRLVGTVLGGSMAGVVWFTTWPWKPAGAARGSGQP